MVHNLIAQVKATCKSKQLSNCVGGFCALWLFLLRWGSHLPSPHHPLGCVFVFCLCHFLFALPTPFLSVPILPCQRQQRISVASPTAQVGWIACLPCGQASPSPHHLYWWAGEHLQPNQGVRGPRNLYWWAREQH